MNKIIFSLIATLAYSVSFAQNGNVGIGTTTPNADARLDITAIDKGLLLPRIALKHTDSAAPLSTKVAGMVVYNTKDTNNVTKGYYYNDGAKWQRISNAADQEWVYENTTKRINLVKSGIGAFKNKVYFDSMGRYINSYYTETPDTSGYFNFHRMPASLMKFNTAGRVVMDYNSVIIDSAGIGSGNIYRIASNILSLPANVTFSTLNNLAAVENVASASGSGTINSISGSINAANISAGTKIQSSYGAFNQTAIAGDSSILNAYGTNSRVITTAANNNAVNMIGSNNAVVFGNPSSVPPVASNGTVNSIIGLKTGFQFINNSNPTVATAYGLLAAEIPTVATPEANYTTPTKIQRLYGVYVQNMNRGTVENYAIYTQVGKNSFGDTVQIRNINALASTDNNDKVVVADATGVLRTAANVPSSNISRTTTLDNVTNANQNLSTQNPLEGYIFDGNSNINVTLPKPVDGKSIFFYAWGGGGALFGNTYTFTGVAAAPLTRPSSSVTGFPTGVSWATGTGANNFVLSLSQPQNNTRFRYTKIEFICFGNTWHYIHRGPY